MELAQIANNLDAVRERIRLAAERSGRKCEDITLVAVSKTWPVEYVEQAVEASQQIFGENKLQEGQQKIPHLSSSLEWHYIGKLQRNKVRKVLSLFEVIHSVDSLKLASYLAQTSEELGCCPRILLQVNIGAEQSKSGFSVEGLKEQCAELLSLKSVQIEGLMCIPPAVENQQEARGFFQAMVKLRDELQATHACELPQLSMGMSKDFEVAIEEGATMVRVGSQIFGERGI